jgi:hypothetical protein
VPFEGTSTGNADGTALFVGVYDSVQEIAKVTITSNTAGGTPQGIAIGDLEVASNTRSRAQGVYSESDLPQDGMVHWTDVGPSLSQVAPGTVVPVNGISGLNVTVSNGAGQAMDILTECPGAGCAWGGDFAPGAALLYSDGHYDGSGNYVGNVPVELSFSSPQRGVGFRIQPDSGEPTFTATVCAYDGANTQLGCVPFEGTSTGNADGTALFVGVYDSVQEIAKVTITSNTAGGTPQGIAIGDLEVASSAQPEMMPSSVMVPAGATAANFTVHTHAVSSASTMSITGSYNGTRSAVLAIRP